MKNISLTTKRSNKNQNPRTKPDEKKRFLRVFKTNKTTKQREKNRFASEKVNREGFLE